MKERSLPRLAGMAGRIQKAAAEFVDAVREQSDIWLNSNEPEGRLPCGCRLVRDERGSGDPAFYFCPGHRRLEPAA
ncbi:MAG: hypothetical protein ACYCPQ_10380 [Elusimicrobiota bacterium]